MSLKFTRRRVLAGAAGITAAAVISHRSNAQGSGWKPNSNVRIIVPAAPGGLTDVMGRLFAPYLQNAWGQSVVVENKSGGGGTIGTLDYIRQKPDGHTLLIGNPGPNAIAYSIFRNLQYKPDQLVAVSNLIRVPNIVSAHPSTGIKTIAQLIAALKATPDKLTFGTSGTGQSPHLTAAWFLQLTGLKMPHLPFRGAGPAIAAALGGEPPILFDNLFPSLPQVLDGKLNGLAVTTTERNDLAPNLPTMAESAPELAKFDVSSWFCVFYNQGTRNDAVLSLNAQCKTFLENEEVKKKIAAFGARPDYGTPQQFKAFVDAETEKFAGIIKREGLQMDVN
ncbi:tripartite tricarboxylate transporter family receptor [Variibacter gotjawalensis]|uniref:Tripartite tricarboxylate transporter family receptor n=1 Tax=Variibacter gotjawalensis TaxID=1333996 RepID=A0A0S3PXE4_9BRAD|nr:tripartite tricarboxylate transporter substrate binding protein [Variibacter gotjawalensis]NIK46393.1 tripartite-type tricarboxylate transporter receptor subunit TctC [Variibacter gotjawalensis]RZS48303.1 tripartite-type tricarboxylate transporter receptor subunit TctC [Variibacter gotjawalensis]BAT60563.1 tripartite tricarboxylate transporter family receptor [Variibacter gotjawalensis]